MKKIFSFIFNLILIFIFTSCSTTGFKDFYDPWFNDSYFPEESYLEAEVAPEIIKTSDLDAKYREVSSNWYWCIGSSGFNGSELSDKEITTALTKLCIDKKAKIAIWSKQYTDTRSGVYSVPHTNYHSYTNSNGYMSTYTTTSYSTSSYSIQRYDFSSYLFVSIPEDYRLSYSPGFSVANLTQQDRDKYKQNTGCFINIVYKDTNAFYANLVHGDIITKINDIPILSAEDFLKFRSNSNSGDVWNMTIVRGGFEKQITLSF